MSSEPNSQSDVSEDSFAKQLTSFGYIYWVANLIELIERFAYFGVRVGLPVFFVLSIGEGGPQLTQIQKGTILSVWAVVQCFVPVVSGGFADRFGYKVCIATYAFITSTGYLIMGFSIQIAEWLCGSPLAEARPLEADYTYTITFAGAMFVAVGTGIFKPGVQGLLANEIPKSAASLGWGVFYQMVNLGGFVGPLVAGLLRKWEWHYVFIACAAGALCNLLPLLLFREPEHPQRDTSANPFWLFYKAFRGLLEPRLFFFTITFAGFWFMFFQLFDILPNFIEEWVDSRGVANTLIGWFSEKVVPTVNGGNLTQEWIISFNAMLICTFAFAIAYFTGKVASLSAIIVGIGVSTVAIYGIGFSMTGWWVLGAIGVFSFGEMMASPTKMRYIASIAPPGKEGQYMGYANFTVGIGWATGAIAASYLYQHFGDKFMLARDYLVQKAGMSAEAVADKVLPKDKVMATFQDKVGVNAWEARELLWNHYDPSWMWTLFAGIGVAAMIAIGIYTWVVRAADTNPNHSLNTHGEVWVRVFLIPICIIMVAAAIGTAFLEKNGLPNFGVSLIALFFVAMFILSFIEIGDERRK